MTGVTGNKAAFIAMKAGVAAGTILAAHKTAKKNRWRRLSRWSPSIPPTSWSSTTTTRSPAAARTIQGDGGCSRKAPPSPIRAAHRRRSDTGERLFVSVPLMLRILMIVLASCAAVQLVSATWVVSDFTTPNVSREIAEHLVATGEYAVGGARAYHLPGEPLLIAAGLHLPSALRRYLHLPVVLLFVGSVTATAFAVCGPRVAAIAGGLATVDPFVVAHGPVWTTRCSPHRWSGW